ncbi:MAG: sterol desaturase family protein [Myxococcales bacterium]|nr:sterol desaturase family protein [Myxococcales bacterium]
MRTKLEWFVARGAFPLAVIAAIGGAILWMDAGVSPDAVTAQMILLSYLFIALLERLFPLHPEWSRSHGDLGADVGLGVTNAIVLAAAQPLFIVASVAAASWLSAEYGARLWPQQWPLAIQLLPALVIAELVEYSAHRAMHEVPWLWPLHAPHHSAKRLYWLNALRFHPVDLLVVGPGKLVPLVMLGAGGPVIALVGIFSAVHGVFQHANLPCRLGPLNWFFSMAELHRWHHSPDSAEANHNYGGNLILWDIVFGTRWLPQDREPPVATGIASLPNFPKGYRALLGAPFRWRRLVAESGLSDPTPGIAEQR